jgi:cell division protein FtsZ
MAYRSAFASEKYDAAIHTGREASVQANPSDGRSRRIKVIGVGSGGVRVVGYMMSCGLKDLEFVCADTDAKILLKSSVPSVVQMGACGLGAARPYKGQMMAEGSVDKVREAIAGSDALFITACLGSGAGSGASPVIARTGKEMGMLTVGLVTMPFEWEGPKRTRNAEHALAELAIHVDWLIVVHSERLFDVLGDEMTQDELFSHVNSVLNDAAVGMAKILNSHDDMRVSLDEVGTVIGMSGHPEMDTLMVITRGGA